MSTRHACEVLTKKRKCMWINLARFDTRTNVSRSALLRKWQFIIYRHPCPNVRLRSKCTSSVNVWVINVWYILPNSRTLSLNSKRSTLQLGHNQWNVVQTRSGVQTSTVNLYAPRFLYVGQAFSYSPENAFYIFNQQIYFIIWYLLDRASLI